MVNFKLKHSLWKQKLIYLSLILDVHYVSILHRMPLNGTSEEMYEKIFDAMIIIGVVLLQNSQLN